MVAPAKAVRVIPVGLCALAALALSEVSALACWKEWDVGDEIQVSISSPANGAIVAPGSNVTCSVDLDKTKDVDHWVWVMDEVPPEQWPQGTDNDDLVKPDGQPNYIWSCSSGTFPNGYTGPTVTWVPSEGGECHHHVLGG